MIRNEIGGSLELPGSKSILNRLLIISTYLHDKLSLTRFSQCDDIKTLVSALKQIGLKTTHKKDTTNLLFEQNAESKGKINNVFIKDSATGFRLLLARLAGFPGVKTNITISSQLKKRPIKPLIDALKTIGAHIIEKNEHYQIIGTQFEGGELNISANISSQFLSALLLITPSYKKDLKINLKGKIVSSGYLDMTIEIMKTFGIKVIKTKRSIFVPAGQYYKNPKIFKVEPDFSSASYFFALGAFSLNGICIKFDKKKSLQPDFSFLKFLELMGAKIEFRNSFICVKKRKLHGLSQDMSSYPDLVPTIAILALFADSPTSLRGLGHLKYKESNRLLNLKKELAKLGCEVKAECDSLKIYPLQNPHKNIKMETYDDHRLVMSFGIINLLIDGEIIREEQKRFVNKSFPEFFKILQSVVSSQKNS